MDKDAINAIIWKEFQEIKGNRSLMIAAFSFPAIFSVLSVYSTLVLKGAMHKTEIFDMLIDNIVLYVSFLTTLYIGYLLTSQLFYKEKITKNIETLLCTPIDLKSIWFGKISAIFSIAYLISLLFAFVVLVATNSFLSIRMIPSTNGFFLVLIVLPLLGFSVFGILGFINLWLLKPTIVNIASVLIFIAVSSNVGRNLAIISLNWKLTVLLLVLSLVLLVITSICIRFLNKERIILTIPYE